MEENFLQRVIALNEMAINRFQRQRWLATALTVGLIILLATQGWSADTGKDLTTMSLEDLMLIEVTSVSKKAERLSDAPAAIFVITREDIRRSGVTNIPDVLRMVPGVEVARIDSNKWAISARGFQTRFADKLLVLIDGRSVYSNLYSGVWWDVQDTMIEDIERIEVIRGPGATLWGANAVNGVINIITCHASETQGRLVTVGGGTHERGFAGVRHGLKVGEETYLRLYAKYFERGETRTQSGPEANDSWNAFHTGFRLDRTASDDNTFTLQGDAYREHANGVDDVWTLTPPYTIRLQEYTRVGGSNILGRWTHVLTATSQLSLQGYYDHTERHDSFLHEDTDTMDLNLQHRFQWFGRNDIVWGIGYRMTQDAVSESEYFILTPSTRRDQLFSGFLQNEFTLIPERLRWIIGTKLEHNDYTGFEFQPSTRLSWTITPHQSAWAAISRAVRTPSRIEHGLETNYYVFAPVSPAIYPTVVTAYGNANFKSEEVIAYEGGYRLQPTRRFNIDISCYFNDYDHIRNSYVGTPFFLGTPVPHAVFPIILDSSLSAKIYGTEVAVGWKPIDRWQIKASYTYAEIREAATTYLTTYGINFGIPRHQVSLRSLVNLPHSIEVDAWLRYVGGFQGEPVDAYTTMDLRIGWRPISSLEFSLVGQNLLQESHPEFCTELYSSQVYESRRSAYAKITLHF